MYLTQIGTKTKKTALYLLGKPRTKDEICVKYILPALVRHGLYLSYPLCKTELLFELVSDKSKIEWTDAPQCGVRKSETGRELDRRTYDEFPERRQTPVPDLEFGRNALERLETELV